MQYASVLCPFMGFSSLFWVHWQSCWLTGLVLNAFSSEGWQCVFWVGATLEWQSALPGPQKRALSVFGRKAHGSLRAYKHSNSTVSPEPDVLMFYTFAQQNAINKYTYKIFSSFFQFFCWMNVSGLM